MNVLLCGGGTGGHIYPGIAIGQALAGRANVLFVGNAEGLEAKLVPAAGFPVAFVTSGPLARKFGWRTLAALASTARGIVQALAVVARFRPDWVIATGGYASFPVVVAAKALRTMRIGRPRIALLETNAFPGLTNRVLAPLVDEVWGAFPDVDSHFGAKYVLLGTPVRASLRRRLTPAMARANLGLDPEKTTVVVMGGSQGARSLNEATAALVTRRKLPTDWQIVHISGQRDHEYMRVEEAHGSLGNHVTLFAYLDDPASAYAAADVVVARSGASTLAELAATGTPAVLVPYPFASEQHQLHNAEAFARSGAARIILDSGLNGDALWWTLLDVLKPATLAAMRSAAGSLAAGDPLEAIVTRVAGASAGDAFRASEA